MAIEKIKILVSVFKLPAKQHCQFLPFQPIHLENGPNGLYWQCCLAGSSKTAPRIFIFSFVLGAKNLSYVKSIETHVRTFLPLNISVVGSVGNYNKL